MRKRLSGFVTADLARGRRVRWLTNAALVIVLGLSINIVTAPTSQVIAAGSSPIRSAVSTQQYSLANSDGSTWQTMDAANLSVVIAPAVNTTALIEGLADLFTNTAGYNQDLGIFVSANGGPEQ